MDPDGSGMLSIAPGEYLDADVLFKAMNIAASSRPGSIVLNPQLTYALAYESSSAQDVLETLRTKISSATGQVFVPLLLDYHYVLAVLYPSDRIVKYYDSVAGPKKISSNYRDVIKKLIGDDATWVHNTYACPQQLNHVDCGVSVFFNAMKLIIDPETTKIELPVTPQILLWHAGRRSLLELCRTPDLAGEIESVEKALDHAITSLKEEDPGSLVDQLTCLNVVTSYVDELLQLSASFPGTDPQALTRVAKALQETGACCLKAQWVV